MRIVLDTNVLLMALPTRSPYRIIFDGIGSGEVTLLISNEVLSEYFEILSLKTTEEIARNVTEFLINSPSIEQIEPHFRWNIITADPDDNKYVDLAVAGNALFLVSNDRHFRVLKELAFPQVNVINALDFLEFLNEKPT